MSILSNNILRTISTQLITQLFGIVSGVFIARALGPEGRGIYAIYIAAIALFASMFGFSIETGILFFVSNKRISIGRIKAIALLIIAGGMLLTIALSLLFMSFWPGVLFPNDGISIFWIFCVWGCVLLSMVGSVYSGFIQGMQRYDIVNKINLINAVLNLIFYGAGFLLYTLGYYRMGVKEVIIIVFVVTGINAIFWHLNFKKIYNYKLEWGSSIRKDLRIFFGFIGISHLSVVINFFNSKLVLWIIAFYLDNFSIGIFSMAAGIASMLSLVSSPVSVVLLPYLTSANEHDGRVTFLRYSRILFTAVALLAIVGWLTANWIIPLVYGIEFLPSVPLFWILLLGAVFSCQVRLFATHLISVNLIRYNLFATIIGFIATIIGNVILIRYFKMTGAAWAANITCWVMFLFTLFVLLKKQEFRFVDLFIIKIEDLKMMTSQVKRKLVRK